MKNKKLEVQGITITITEKNQESFICVTDIANGFEGGTSLIEKWLRNKNTIEFLAVWEKLYNPNFNSTEYEGIRMEAGSNRFVMSIKQWIEKTNAVGITATTGRYGGTYAHQDIATEFCSWLSPEFKLLLNKEFQRLKQKEYDELNQVWDLHRLLSKINYHIQTDSIKKNILSSTNIPKNKEYLVYADEADILNIALFGMTAKEWREQNPEKVKNGMNIRDFATLHELTVLSNLESYNSILIKKGITKSDRLQELSQVASEQLVILEAMNKISIDKLKSPNQKLVE